MDMPLCHNNTGEQEAWRMRIQRRLDDLNNLKLPVRNAVSLQRRASPSEQQATERHRISPRSSESNDAVATDVSIHGTVAEQLSVPPSGQFAPCPLCRISEDRTDQCDFREGDWIDIDVWVDSAFRGCNYCRIIASGAVHNFRPYRRAADNIKLRIRALAGPFSNMMIDMRSQKDNLQSLTDNLQSLEFHITKGDSYRYSVFGPYTWGWRIPSKESQIDRAAYAIQYCVNNHEACHQHPGELPSRLIEISIFNGENMLRIVDTQTLDKGCKQRYIALSHCWGSGQPLRLLKSNIASMKARIPWEDFARLFRDAIELTWSLDVRYLWIDALCIIQDDDLDWQTESTRMGDIYRSSFLTVLASRASNNGGTIFAGNGEFIRPDGTPDVETRRGILKIHTRAWTFQEFILSRRVLELGYFGQQFLCCSTVKDPQRDHEFLSHRDLSRARFDFNNVLKSRNENDQVWIRIIEDYAGRDLTQLSDRLPALSGLASLYMKQTGLKGRYLAGLWGRSFLRGLHWTISHKEPISLKYARSISRYHAPSWSWSSLKRPIVYLSTFDILSGRGELEINSGSRPALVKERGVERSSTRVTPFFAQVVRVQCEIKGSNPFGEVTAGTAVLKGLLLDARMSFRPNIDAATSAQLKLMHSTRLKMCSGYGSPENSQPMPSWVMETTLPHLADNHRVFLDSDIEMVHSSPSLPRTCAYLRRRQLERQADGPSEARTHEETQGACLHVSVLILACINHSRAGLMGTITGLVLGRPDPDKEVYERLALFCPRNSTRNSTVTRSKEPRHFFGAMKDVTII